MKFCFYLQRRFAPIGHEVARILQKKYGVTEFCGYVELRSSLDFLKSQKDIPYTNLILEEEIISGYKKEVLDMHYLESLEKTYGPNLWRFINHDRVIRYNLFVRSYPSSESVYSREDMLKMLQRMARTLEKFLDDEKPDAIFFNVVSGMGSYLLYEMAKKRNIKCVCLYNPRLDERYALSDDYFHYGFLEKAIAEIETHPKENQTFITKAEEYLHAFQKTPKYYLEASAGAAAFTKTPIRRSAHFKFLQNPKRFFASFGWFFRSFYVYFANPHRADYTTIKPWDEIFDKTIRKLRVLIGYNDLYTKPDTSTPFAYFALQQEPEGLPMLLGPNYAFEQIWILKQIARALPIHYVLYVKDHPVMVGRRPRKYYQELLKIPNVRLVNPSFDGPKLIGLSDMVFTISGTSGMEAAFLKKPAIVFSKVFYTLLPNVVRCVSVEELPEIIASRLQHSGYDEEKTKNFIAALYKESVAVDLTQLNDVQGGMMSAEDKRTLEPLADLIAKKLQLSHGA